VGSIVTVPAPVSMAVSVADPVRGPGSGVRSPESGVRLLRRDQVNPVTVSDSVTASVSDSVTGSDTQSARRSHFHDLYG